MKKSLDDLKAEYLGKTFGFLTVENIFRNTEQHKWFFTCRCKCGAVVHRQLNKVTSGHTTSCGCYVKSSEFANKRRTWCSTNKDKIRYDDNRVTENINNLKDLYLNKQFNWLTIIDISVDKSDTGRIKGYVATCKCKCGKDTVTKLNYVLSGHTKSCGCYNSSKEHIIAMSEFWKNNPEKLTARTKKRSKWHKENPDKVKEIGKRHSQWYRDNPDKVKEKSEKYEEWCRNNHEKLAEQGKNHSQYYKDNPDVLIHAGEKISQQYKNRRINSDLTRLIEVIHPSYINNLLSGDLLCTDIIKTKCPVCGEYDCHTLYNIWSYSKNEFSCDALPMCNSCRRALIISKYEQEIADFISTFYTGECVRNSRDMISPLELDLYYPEKKIAIEFNGDYWHDESHKPNNYHSDKYIKCKSIGIVLVSIFETYWKTERDSIMLYLKDLFNNKFNMLSINENGTHMNNNYPSPLMKAENLIEQHYYVRDNNKKVYTCGFSKLIKG